MNCKDHESLYRKQTENPDHLRPYITFHPETSLLPLLSLRHAKQIILVEISDVQDHISFFIKNRIKILLQRLCTALGG